MIADYTSNLSRIVRMLAYPKRYNPYPNEHLEFETAHCLEDTIQIRVSRWVGELTRDNPTYRHAIDKVPVLEWRRYLFSGDSHAIIDVVQATLDKLVILVRTLPVPFRIGRKSKHYLKTNEQIWHETQAFPRRRKNHRPLHRQNQRRVGA